jgi:hypothetical protein
MAEEIEGFKDYVGLGTRPNEFSELSQVEASGEKYAGSMRASHCMIYAKSTNKFIEEYETKAVVLVSISSRQD